MTAGHAFQEEVSVLLRGSSRESYVYTVAQSTLREAYAKGGRGG